MTCVNRDFRRFCDGCATRSAAMAVPFNGLEAYIAGVSSWLARHAYKLQAVHLRFEVRAVCSHVASRVPHRPPSVIEWAGTIAVRVCVWAALVCRP